MSSLVFDTKINTSGFNKGIGSISRATDSLKSSFSKLGGIVAAAFSVKVIKDFASECKSLYDVQLEAETRLGQVMRNTMGATEEQIQSVKDYSSELQKLGVIGDEVQLSGLQELGTYIENADSLKKMNVVLNDMLAQQYGLNATAESSVTIATMLGKVLEGQTSALSRYGYSFDSAQEQLLKFGTEEQRVATLAEVVEQSVGGMNEALANTSAGRMKQLENTMGDIKEQFGEAVYRIEVLFLPALNKLADMLAKVASLADSVAAAFAKVFGNGSDSSAAAAAKGAEETAESYADMAESAEEAAEANENSLASFDKVTKLNDDKTSGGSSSVSDSDSFGAGGTAVYKVDVETDEAADRIAQWLEKVKGGFEMLRDTAKDLLGIAVGYVTDNFGKIFDNIFGGLKREADELLQTFDHIWSDMQTLADPLKKYFKDDFTPYLQQVFTTMGDIAVGLFDTFNMVFADIWEVAVFPILQNFVTDGLPLVTQFSTECWSTLDTLFWDVKDLFDTAWTDFIKPILEEAVKIWTDTVTLLREKWDKWGKPIFDGIREALDNTAANIKKYWEEWLRPIFDEAMAKADEIWSEHILPLLDNLLDFFGELATGWLDFYNGTLSPIIGWLIDKLAPTVSEVGRGIVDTIAGFVTLITDSFNGLITFLRGAFKGDLKQAWEGIKQIFSAYWTAIKDIFAPVASWFGEKFTTAWGSVKSAFANVKTFFETLWSDIKAPFETVATWFEEKFSTAWQKVKDVFSTGGEIFDGIKEGISGVFTDTVNYIIDGINTVISTPFNTINDVLQTLRDTEIAGWNPFADIPSLDVPQIPRLATGTVVPANYGEFLAVLGDNKREAEIVSPISAMKQALMEAMVEVNGTAGTGGQKVQLVVPLYINGREIGRAVVDDINAQIRQTGKSPIKA